MKSKKHNSCPTCNVELGVRPWEQLMCVLCCCRMALTRVTHMHSTHTETYIRLCCCCSADPAIQELTRKLLPDDREQDKRDGTRSTHSLSLYERYRELTD